MNEELRSVYIYTYVYIYAQVCVCVYIYMTCYLEEIRYLLLEKTGVPGIW